MKKSITAQDCARRFDYLQEQHRELRLAIESDRRRLSAAAGHEVGLDRARHHFISFHLLRFRAAFRHEFCGEFCPEHARCRWRHAKENRQWA